MGWIMGTPDNIIMFAKIGLALTGAMAASLAGREYAHANLNGGDRTPAHVLMAFAVTFATVATTA